MPFPFLAPINPWVVDIMEQREANAYQDVLSQAMFTQDN